jgi:hypothetical protein
MRGPITLLLALAALAATAVPAQAILPPPDGGGGPSGTKVKRLRPWKSSNLYRVQQDFHPRVDPARAAAKQRTLIVKGSWLHIDCQRHATTEKGRELWDRVAGGFVPDGVMKTYTDGRLSGSPTCKLPHPHRVYGLGRWSRSKLYRVLVSRTTEKTPKLYNGTGILVRRGRWVRITCQVTGEKHKGSTLWDRIGPGGYYPDSELKTFYAGRIPGAPKCKTPRKPVTPVFMALGDSYSSGLGSDVFWNAQTGSYNFQRGQYYARGPVGGPTSKNCKRGLFAWPRLLQGRTRQKFKTDPHTTFLACQGDTTREVLSRQIPHIRKHTRLVTLSIMGNDMGFSKVVEACAKPGSSCSSAVVKQFGKRNAILHAKIHRLDAVLNAIRRKAPRARVLVLGYPALFQPVHESFTWCLGINGSDQRLLNQKGTALNAAIKAATRRHKGVSYISTAGAFRGHGPCQGGSTKVWINPIIYERGKPPIPADMRSMHPNRLGQFMMAEIVAKAKPDLFR